MKKLLLALIAAGFATATVGALAGDKEPTDGKKKKSKKKKSTTEAPPK
jgi:hypothetical protein